MTDLNSVSEPHLGMRIGRRVKPALISGFGGFLVIYILSQLSGALGMLLLVAPFGASCVLVFALPQSPLAQPRNVIGGHLISAFIGIAIFGLLGAHPLSFALAVGLAIAAMQATETLHPPAGADPIVVLATGASWSFLLTPMLAGTILIVAAAYCYHRFVSSRAYPA
ncbi:HPP family protein [Rhizobium sp. P38BS-XIX]|uniref:HPP family protein n=1 Tax=Rhizobium sp. P38BS-XIX TaxID=2726740 RepID=UPI0014570C72|nr:HPP family protein [Rhizobium sp. P38BS-XIX]NLR97617.1 HPP family protein [Rhizobium sp. P38BS-XIX]